LQSLPSAPAAILWFGSNDAAIYWVVLLGAVLRARGLTVTAR
jgi:NitT/TauT family transport system permease protein